MTPTQQKITVYIRNAKKLNCDSKEEEYCLIMRTDKDELFINDLTTITVDGGGSEIRWKLDSKSGISKISKISEKVVEGELFKDPPVEEKGDMVANIVENVTKKVIEGAYYIKYTLDDGKNTPVTIDPFIRIPPK